MLLRTTRTRRGSFGRAQQPSSTTTSRGRARSGRARSRPPPRWCPRRREPGQRTRGRRPRAVRVACAGWPKPSSRTDLRPVATVDAPYRVAPLLPRTPRLIARSASSSFWSTTTTRMRDGSARRARRGASRGRPSGRPSRRRGRSAGRKRLRPPAQATLTAPWPPPSCPSSWQPATPSGRSRRRSERARADRARPRARRRRRRLGRRDGPARPLGRRPPCPGRPQRRSLGLAGALKSGSTPPRGPISRAWTRTTSLCRVGWRRCSGAYARAGARSSARG